MGYLDTRQKIIDTLTGRAVGTQIQPTDHQEFALALLDYIRQVELITASTLVGTAERGTVPVQSDKANLAYVAACPVGETVVFENFHGQDGQPLQYTADVNSAAIIILTWNKEYWIMTAVPTSVLVTADNVNYTTSIRKTYASKEEMEADKNPVDEKNIPITNGQLVSVVNDSDTTHNGIYAREGAGWTLQISFSLLLGATVKDLGVFNSTREVMAAASKIGVVRDYRIAMMVARVNTSDNSKKNSIVINQQITANSNTYTTWQYIFEKNRRYTRYIESNATAVTSVQSVQKDGVRNIEYGHNLGYLKLTDMHGSQVGASVNMRGNDQSALREENSTTENVRLVQTKTFGNTNEVLLTPATSAKAGVMTSAMYIRLETLWHFLNGGEPQEKAANEGGMSIESTFGMMPGSIVEFIQTPSSGKSNISNPIQLAIGDKISISPNSALLQKMSDTSAKVLAYSSGIEYTATQAMVVYIYNENLPISYTHTPGSILNALEARIAALESK